MSKEVLNFVSWNWCWVRPLDGELLPKYKDYNKRNEPFEDATNIN